jgi:hypothetical protein
MRSDTTDFTIAAEGDTTRRWLSRALFCFTLTLLSHVASPFEFARASESAQKKPGEAERPGPVRKSGQPYVPTTDYATRSIEGWTVHVNQALLGQEARLGAEALELLKVKLYEIRRVVPPAACRKLQDVPIWLGVDDGHAPCAEYHPSRDWLAQNGFNPDKAKSVEIGNAAKFLEWSKDQPAMVLHELAHAYLDRVLGLNHRGVKAAYESAQKSHIYESVLRNNGKVERAYALSNPEEYFAEASEAFFGTNDFYPFVRVELKKHDPRLYEVLVEVWNRGSELRR